MRKRKVRPHFEDLRVIDAGSKGKAVAKAPDGRIVFISGAVPGDLVSVQTTRKRKGYYEGYVTAIQEASEDRVTPKCIHFGTCGGCKWQNMSYEAQLKFKQKEVVENLLRIGKLDLPEIDPILPAPQPFYYRNKMEFSFSNNRWLQPEELEEGYPAGSRNALGLHIPGMWDKILDLKECHLMADPVNQIRLAIREYADANGLSFFDPRKQEGLLRTLMIRSTSSGSLMIVLQLFEEDQAGRELLLDYLLDTFPQISSLYYTVNQKKNDTIYDQELIRYAGASCIYETMEGLQFQITPKSFYQTNSEQAYQLYRKVREFAGLSGTELVYDLYTGLGTIAQFVAREAGKVVGIEAVPEAVEAARENAKVNNIGNVSFYSGDMKDLFSREFLAEHGHPEVLITDPPRDGMHKDVIERILEITPSRIVYVSCNSATQARDLALMKDVYEVVRVQPVDMFPQTHHVENIVLLRRRNNP
ncbi:23S rRNA (uracil(1939)-C(5))-methyltransferase RlmD [Robiginitalea aurantiaca]|uniref:23S rRNA (Uracil(1939)-C(5))-methyltransferase RlmD n=1 Tax=Robiginitalea aurantiaca TaxID=3056915 RepID=A0ABT7WGD2_9FLAO|nr:23S rRNA (uracil(1939)-C(5))-methyltransferase RlmD [Robiginitalea aurantiaca]MDM9631977.1 23S rRNA (uracil(1939)-C(5))-methyltransferase RlmD [Robiginitalea aurantiaca]